MDNKVPCQCGSYIEVPAPRLELINQYSVSMICWAHGEPTACANCGAMVIGVIPELNPGGIKLSYMPLPSDSRPINVAVKKEPSRIIKPY